MTNRSIWEQENRELRLEVERLRERIEELAKTYDRVLRDGWVEWWKRDGSPREWEVSDE